MTRDADVPATTRAPSPEPETLAHHLRFLTDHLGPRPIGSEEAQRARRYLAEVIAGIGFPVEHQPFSVTGCVAGQSLVKLPQRVIPSQPVLGSPSTDGRVRALVRPLKRDEETTEGSLPGVIALCPLKAGDEEARMVAAAVRRQAVAAILYREDVPELYSATIASGTAPIPCVTIRSADGWQLAEEMPEIELRVDTTPSTLRGENLLVELGEGGTRPLLFLAHYDTRPGTPGAFRNASGVTVLLGLLARLRGWEAHPLIVGFLDGDELDGAGSRHCRDVLTALGVLTRLRGVVYVSGMGLSGLLVCAKESPRPSLADLVERAVAEEGLLLVPAEVTAAGAMAAPPWRCATVTLTGPPLSAQHTMLDRPDLVSPRLLARTVSALENVVRCAGSLP